jgi:hypothetical protein
LEIFDDFSENAKTKNIVFEVKSLKTERESSDPIDDLNEAIAFRKPKAMAAGSDSSKVKGGD